MVDPSNNTLLVADENKETNLQETQDQYSRMLLLNYHIQDKFKEKSKDINNLTAAQHKKEK